MFGSTSQKPGGFSFGASNATTTTTAPSLNFSNNNNTSSLLKPSNLSFGNASNTPTVGSSLTGPSGLSGISFNKPTTTTSMSTPGFGNNAASTTATASKPSLFGNSSTNPAFNNSLSGLGMNFGAQTQRSAVAVPSTSPYGLNYNHLANKEMPKSLTTSSSEDSTLKLKRKRTNSDASSTNSKLSNPSLVGRIVETFKAPSKYSIEDMRGLFTSTRNIVNNHNTNQTATSNTNIQLENYSKSLGLDIPKIPASKSEYRRLIIKNPRDAFTKYFEIDANKVLLSKSKDHDFKLNSNETKSSPKKIIEELKPLSKRPKLDAIEDPSKTELTFSKPLFEQQVNSIDKNEIIKESTPDVVESNTKESDYWCIPSISELSNMSSLDLTRVPNFTAGRKGYGHLMYKYPVDLTAFEGRWDCLLGETIVFQNRVLQVYSNDSAKPSQGNGLNVPAVITLERAFPKKYDPLNPNLDLIEFHIEKLKSAHGMKFISYDPSNGTYIFEVEHFSIWGIVDEEDDDPEVVAMWKKQQANEEFNEKRKNELQINALEKIAGYGQPGDNWKRQKPDFVGIAPGAFEYPDQDNEDDEQRLTHEGDNEDADGEEIVDALVPTGLSDEDAIDNEKQLELISKNSGLNDIDELVEVRAYEPEVKDIDMEFLNPKTELAISEDWDEQLALSNGFFSVFNKNLDKNHNVNLDPKHVSDFLFGEKNASNLKKALIEPPLNFENSLQYQKCLQAEIYENKFETRLNGIPIVVDNSNVSLSIPLLSFENTNDYNIWELLSILYDNNYLKSSLSKKSLKVCQNAKPMLNHIQDIKRRKLLCNFLQKLISLDLENNFNSNTPTRDTLEKIYYFLCTDKIGDAIQYALNTKNNHVAILLTMLDSNDDTVHNLARSQLREWSNSSINFIPSGVLKIYKLLMGDILSKEYIDHLDGLTWPVVLFLMIKYGNSNKSLNSIIAEFITYAERTGISELSVNKIYFFILKMVSSSKEVISSFEVELQFLLMKHLKSKIQFTSSQYDDTILEFAKKLEKKSMVKEALFILENLNDDKLALREITELLNNNVQTLGFLNSRPKLDELHNVLHIPYSLLHEARSFEFNNLGEFYKSTLELILAGNLTKALDLMLEKVAPKIIISNIASELQKLERLVGEFNTLSESKLGADVYGDYIKSIKLSDEIDCNNSDYEEKKEKLKGLYGSVLNGINSLVDSNRDVKIAKTIMIKRLIGISFKENLKYNPDELLRLKLPESERNYLEAKIEYPNDPQLLTN